MSGTATAALNDVPEAVRPTVACMIDALGSQSHIDHVDAGLVMSSWPSMSPQTQHVYVEYHTVGRQKDDQTIRFIASGTGANLEFGTGLSGLFSSLDKGPDDYRTDRVSRIWRSKCRVRAWVLYN
ncbi:MAG TPA: hypothetical protein VG387_06855 [Rhizomicrobium sp.]|jgi:hypothetical protein|nr:hypothetical protein [Rhizomicrobium sp.]